MKRVLLFVLVACCCALAQAPAGDVLFNAPVPAGTVAFTTFGGPPAPVKGAPYSATKVNESVQTLSDGTHITQSSTGSVARDSQGRTRQDTPLPQLGPLAPEDAPHIVLIQDPVAGFSYTLNLTDKTAWKHPAMPPRPDMAPGVEVNTQTIVVRSGEAGIAGAVPLPPPPPPGGNATFQKHAAEGDTAGNVIVHEEVTTAPPLGPGPMMIHKRLAEADASAEVSTENLGTQMIEGVQATGVRTTRTIPAGKIGNDRPINIVTEVWTSADLKGTVVLSKRNDPRTGEQTFKLTNIQRGEPDASLFTVPSDFKLNDNGAETIIYKVKHQP